jgi:hypothetical protein
LGQYQCDSGGYDDYEDNDQDRLPAFVGGRPSTLRSGFLVGCSLPAFSVGARQVAYLLAESGCLRARNYEAVGTLLRFDDYQRSRRSQ